jgi:glycosyltransferase involved in cell wall biosynthesis
LEKFGKIAVIVPVFNEERTIGLVINNIKKIATLIVVNDGSTDNTGLILKKNKSKKIIIINNKNNLGYENALNLGFKKAAKLKFNTLITYDADNQFYIKDLIKIINLSKKFDLVIGRRPYVQRYSEKVLSKIFKLTFGICDPLCGLKAYSLKLYKKLGYFDRSLLSGTELMIYGLKNNFSTKQININVKKRWGISKFGSGLRIELYILKILFFLIIKN